MRFQKPIKNRKKLYSGVDPRIDREIEGLARIYDCSKSFVTNTLLGNVLGIKLEERYDAETNHKNRKRNR